MRRWHHNDLTIAAGAPDARLWGNKPAGYVFDARGTQHVVYWGTDAHMLELWWDNNGWHYNDLTIAAGAPIPWDIASPVAYVFDAQGTQHVVYWGDYHIHELWCDNSGWHYNDLTIATGAPIAWGDPAAYVFNAQGTQHVVYVATDNHIYDLWWDNNGWHYNDLTLAAGVPITDGYKCGDPVGYGFDAQGTQHVFFRGGGDHHIHELWWDNNGWHHTDVTIAAGAPAADATPQGFVFKLSAYIFGAQGTQHVFYLGHDYHIQELWRDNNGWHYNDVTIAGGGPDAWGDPAGYVFDAQGTQHVAFYGTDDHLHELGWDNNGWHHTDLSIAASAPIDGSYPAAYVFGAYAERHVVYLGPDSHVHELWWGRDVLDEIREQPESFGRSVLDEIRQQPGSFGKAVLDEIREQPGSFGSGEM